MSHPSTSLNNDLDALIKRLKIDVNPQQSANVVADNEQYVESGASASEMMVEEAQLMEYERNDVTDVSRVGMIQASSYEAMADVLMDERLFAIDDQDQPRPSFIVNVSLQQQPSTPSIDYHTDFEVQHRDGPASHSNDIISHERLPSSDSFKEEEINKPLDQYSKMKDGEVLLMHDSGIDDPDRILIFTTQQNLGLLKTSAYWGINCVSKKIPKPFVRCWVIHGFYLAKALPFAYILVRATNESTFERAMKFLPEDVLPKHVMMDYCLKEYKLAQRLFPEARFHCSYSYFINDINRKIVFSSWIHRYSTDEHFHINVEAFKMLAFVKPADVVRYFNVLKKIIHAIYPSLIEFCAHMEQKWIGNPDAVKAPEILIELWNVYDLVVNQYPRTNEFFEDWLERYYDHFPSENDWDNVQPVTIYEFIDSIKAEQRETDYILSQMDLSLDLSQFGEYDEDLLKVVKDYDKYKPMEYLRAVFVASGDP